MGGYLNREQETIEALKDGWLHTGDVGELDEQGYLTVTGRKKDMIISGGLNVYPREIEDIIHRVDSVAEVAVVGVEDEKWGEAAVAVIVPAGSTDSVDVEAIDRLCRKSPPPSSAPARSRSVKSPCRGIPPARSSSARSAPWRPNGTARGPQGPPPGSSAHGRTGGGRPSVEVANPTADAVESRVPN